MDHLGFKPCKADPDLWMRAAVKPTDGTSYWEYVLLYVDDALSVSHNPREVLEKEIGKYWTLKPDSIGAPKLYLGNKVSKVNLENGVSAWSFNYLNTFKRPLRMWDGTSRSVVSHFLAVLLHPSQHIIAQKLMSLIPYLRQKRLIISPSSVFFVGGRVDITCEVSMMASMMVSPRRGHLDQLFHIFAYLQQRHNSEMVFDPTPPSINETHFEKQDWRYTPYGTAKEILPPNMPLPKGLGFTISSYVDSDHAGDSITRRSRTGFIVYLNRAPIFWFSKKQGGIETSSFGSEFIAIKQCCEYIRGLRYKLRMMGIPVEGPAFIFGDNKSVLANSSLPDSVLQKKSNSIAYHFVREGSAADEWRIAYTPTNDNIADLLTKPLGGGAFIRMILHYVY